MWRGGADPRLRSTICSFGVLDCALDWQRFLAACEWGTRRVPRFRPKGVKPAFGLGNPVWDPRSRRVPEWISRHRPRARPQPAPNAFG